MRLQLLPNSTNGLLLVTFALLLLLNDLLLFFLFFLFGGSIVTFSPLLLGENPPCFLQVAFLTLAVPVGP